MAYRVYSDEATAALQSEALWRAYCASRGVTPEGIEAGTETLDTRPDGTPVFPPKTRGAVTMHGRGIAEVITPRSGTGAMLKHRNGDEAFDGTTLRVAGQNVMIQSGLARKVEREALPVDLRDELDAREAEARGLG